jgi:hypothetical protein
MTQPDQVVLHYQENSVQFSFKVLLQKSRLFAKDPNPFISGYHVKSNVGPFEFNAFLDLLEKNQLPEPELRKGVLQLVEEFLVSDAVFLSAIIREQNAMIDDLINANRQLETKIDEWTTQQNDFEARFEEWRNAKLEEEIQPNSAEDRDK